uniref:Reverse transcriptase domain-containing protein n=1 Tax=Tanacetum cinerariifolium TaxID=118510 RepID=A0A6L2JAD3_TANCI|nr:reverse transcriptase domain-containing protein [Tanacetum cinerariifolium]
MQEGKGIAGLEGVELVLEIEELLLPLAGVEEGLFIVIQFKVSALNVDFDFKIDLIVFGPETGSAPVSFSSGGRGVCARMNGDALVEKVTDMKELMSLTNSLLQNDLSCHNCGIQFQEPPSPYLEPKRSIHQTKKRNPFIPLEDKVPKVKYPPFENLFEAEVVYNPFIDLSFPTADDQPMWRNNRVVVPTFGAAIIAVDLGKNFTVKGHHLSMIKDRQFNGRAQANPYKHEDLNKKKPTMSTEDIEEADIEETTTTYDPPVKPKAKTTNIHDDTKDEVDETEKEVEPSSSKETKSDPPPLKVYKPKIPYPQCIRKENMEERYAKLINLIKEVRINVPLIDVLAGMLNYGKFLKDLVSNKNFVILQMEEDDKVPVILGRPFLHTVDAIIRVKNKEINLGVRDDRITFLIDKAMQHSHFNDDTCFHMDVIDEVTEEELDALLDDYEPFLNTSEKINETSLDKEFEEFMVVNVEEIPKQEEEVKGNFKELPIEGNLRIKTFIQDPPTNLEMKPLPKHLKYAYLEKDSLLPVVISALLKDDEKKCLVSILKKYKEAFAWKHLIFRTLPIIWKT